MHMHDIQRWMAARLQKVENKGLKVRTLAVLIISVLTIDRSANIWFSPALMENARSFSPPIRQRIIRGWFLSCDVADTHRIAASGASRIPISRYSIRYPARKENVMLQCRTQSIFVLEIIMREKRTKSLQQNLITFTRDIYSDVSLVRED